MRRWFSYIDGDIPPGKEITPAFPPSPIFELDTGWYFYDETWTSSYGPFSTKEEALTVLEDYGHWLDTGISNLGTST